MTPFKTPLHEWSVGFHFAEDEGGEEWLSDTNTVSR